MEKVGQEKDQLLASLSQKETKILSSQPKRKKRRSKMVRLSDLPPLPEKDFEEIIDEEKPDRIRIRLREKF